MSKKFLNLVSITPVTFTLLIWDDKTFNLRFTQMLETLVYNDQGWWQRAKKMHKNEMASQTVSSLKDLAPGVQTLDSAIHLAWVVQTLDSAIHRINNWIAIYPVDNAIHILNNWGQINS